MIDCLLAHTLRFQFSLFLTCHNDDLCYFTVVTNGAVSRNRERLFTICKHTFVAQGQAFRLMPSLHSLGPIWQSKGREYGGQNRPARKPYVYIWTCPTCDSTLTETGHIETIQHVYVYTHSYHSFHILVT